MFHSSPKHIADCKANHPSPGLCDALHMHVAGHLWGLWNTSAHWRSKRCADAGVSLSDLEGRFPPVPPTPPTKLPGVITLAKNAAKAAAKHVANPKHVTASVKAERLKTCRSCDHCDTKSMRCRHASCGCFLKTKSGWASESCPLGKWDSIMDTTSDAWNDSDWAVGITTAPRGEYTLPKTVSTMQAAGWKPIVFAEPKSRVDKIDAPIVQRREPLGCWHNWYQMAHALLDNTDAKWIMTVQDDITIANGSREVGEQYLTANPGVGFLSFYTPKHYQRRYNVMSGSRRVCSYPDQESANARAAKRQGWRVVTEEWPRPAINQIATRSLWGACALAFPRESLRKILDHKIARNWRGANGRQDRPATKNSDTGIGKICNSLKLPMMFVNPSLASHIAVKSSISHGDNSGRRNCLYHIGPADPAIVLSQE